MDSITSIDSRVSHVEPALRPVEAGQPSQPRMRSETGSGGEAGNGDESDQSVMSTVFRQMMEMEDHIDIVTVQLVYPSPNGQAGGLDVRA